MDMKTTKPYYPTQIKLCGLRREEDIRIVNEVMPEYAGFILAEGRRRSITPERMRELTSILAPGIRRVAVFLDQDPEWICHLAQQDLMDLIQLHGSESDEVIRMLQKKTGRKVIKVIRIDEKKGSGINPDSTEQNSTEQNEIEQNEIEQNGTKQNRTGEDPDNRRKIVQEIARRAQECPADLILLDHGAGGSGEAFDWTLAGAFSRDFILAGGLTPENVREAIDRTHPMAVDVSSGVETDHAKDREKVQRFVQTVRRA